MGTPLALLVIDPHEDDVQLLTSALADAHDPAFSINHVLRVDDGLTVVRQTHVDLVILDIQDEGVQSFYRLRAELPDLPIVMLTNLENEPLALKLLGQGAQDYQVKSKIAPMQLIRCFQFAVERHRRLVEVTGAPTDANVIDLGRSRFIEGMTSAMVDGFRLLRLLGEGSIGRVFLAEPEDDECPYPAPLALKLLKPPSSLPNDRKNEWLERFCREAELAKRVVHPHIVRIHDIGMSIETGGPYIVMEYVDGKILTRCQDHLGYLSFEQKAVVLRQIAQALAAIHAEAICHLDIKPQNILVTREVQAKVSDFGIAQPMGSIRRDILGSPAYMAPEAIQGAVPHSTSDIYSLGVVAYEWLLHRLPFESRILERLREQVIHERPLEPRKLSPKFPLQLQHILAKMLRKNPDRRYQSTDELIHDLDDFINGHPPTSQLSGTRAARWLRPDWS